jgi:hypothetical protein
MNRLIVAGAASALFLVACSNPDATAPADTTSAAKTDSHARFELGRTV